MKDCDENKQNMEMVEKNVANENEIQELRDRVEMLESMLDALPVEIWYKETDGTYKYVNKGWADVLEREREDCLGKKDFEVFDESFTALYRQSDWDVISGESSGIVKTETLEGNASIEFKNVFRDKNGKMIGIVGCAIERQFDALQKVLMEDQRGIFNIIFENSPVPMAVYNQDNRVPIFVNRQFYELLGISEFTALNTDWHFITHPDDIDENDLKYAQMCAGKTNSFKIKKRFMKSNGDIIWTYTTLLRLPSETEGEYLLLCIIEDITERMQVQESIEYLNFNDQLTGCYNRNYFRAKGHRFDNEIYFPLSCVVIDINGLKGINDRHGYDAGDRLLKELVEIFRKNTTEQDMIARVDGDEFAILLPYTPMQEAHAIVENIREDVANIEEKREDVTLTFGIAVKKDKKMHMKELYRNAEDEMYRAKIDSIGVLTE